MRKTLQETSYQIWMKSNWFNPWTYLTEFDSEQKCRDMIHEMTLPKEELIAEFNSDGSENLDRYSW